MAVKAAKYAKDESVLQSKLATVIRRESEAAERDRQKANRREQARVDRMLNAVEGTMEARFAELREPKKEKLRILFLGATSEGDLRVDREIKRIEAAVKVSTNRDLVEILPKMAATKSDLLDGLTAFSPHVVHFSGHSNEELLTLDQDVDVQNPGACNGGSIQFLFQRVRQWVEYPQLVFDASVSQTLAWTAFVEEFLLADRLEAWTKLSESKIDLPARTMAQIHGEWWTADVLSELLDDDAFPE